MSTFVLVDHAAIHSYLARCLTISALNAMHRMTLAKKHFYLLVHEVSYVASRTINLNIYLKQHDTDDFPHKLNSRAT